MIHLLKNMKLRLVTNTYSKKIDDRRNTYVRAIEERMHRTTIFSIIFVIIGLFIGLLDLFLLRNFLNYTSYFINIFAWVFTWEGIDAFFLDRRILIQEKIKAYRLAAAKIEIVEFEQY